MDTIKTASDLKMAIEQLEFESTAQRILLKEELHLVCDRLKPFNIIKDTLTESATVVKTSLTGNFLGVTSGLIARKIILGKTNNPITRFLGLMLERFVSRGVEKRAEGIKSFAGTVLEKISNKHD